MAWLPYERLIIETSLNPAEAHASLAQVVAPDCLRTRRSWACSRASGSPSGGR